ncbi:MAG: DNA polymerase III subunit beta [Candidatus Acidiferrum sp.]
MKVTIRINEFKRVLAESRHLVKDKASIPFLACVKVDVNSLNRATMTGFDMNKAIVQSFEVLDGEPGSFLLPAKETHDFLKGHVGGTATIESTLDGQHVTVKAGKFLMKACSTSVSCFPALEAMPEVRRTISLKFIKNVVTRVESACHKDQNRFGPPAIRLESDGQRLRAIGTDGYRIAIAEVLGDLGMFTVLLPKNFLPLIKRRAGTTVQFAESETNYFYRTESVLLQCRKPTTAFPRYQKVVDGIAFKGAIRVASADLKSAIVNVLSADKKLWSVTFDVRGESLQVSASGLNSAPGSLVVASEGNAETAVNLNPRHVLDFLTQAQGDITMHFPDDARGPVKFSCGRSFEHLLMPMKPPDPEAKSSVA